MGKKRVLVQWVGHSDLRAMAATLPAARRDAILNKIKGPLPQASDRGPTKTLLDTQSFDEIALLSNYPADWNKAFASWLGRKVRVQKVSLDKPTDYPAIFKIADDALAAVRGRKDWPDTELCLHLSPGTPAMAAIWLLLGKTRYPATFYETYAGESWKTEIPFDLTIDVIPEVLRDPDVHWQHLASESPSEVLGFSDITGDSRAIRDAVGRAKRAAVRSVSVLLLGETGTGKEMFAKAIHQASPRRGKPFQAINCAALSKTLLESELFGHVKGAFTGADRPRAGAFEEVDGGTLFLDEIGECDLETQAKLLRVLQPVFHEGASIRLIRRLGDERDKQVDVRIVAATNKDLHRAMANGTFREDLYYRLASVTITFWADISSQWSQPLNIPSQVQAVRQLALHAEFVCLITPHIRGMMDDESDFAVALIQSVLRRPSGFRQVEMEVHTEGPDNPHTSDFPQRVKIAASNTATSLQSALTKGQEVRLVFWPHFVDRYLIGGVFTETSAGTRVRSPRWGVAMQHIARRVDGREQKPPTSWSLMTLSQIGDVFHRFCTDTSSKALTDTVVMGR